MTPLHTGFTTGRHADVIRFTGRVFALVRCPKDCVAPREFIAIPVTTDIHSPFSPRRMKSPRSLPPSDRADSSS
jgi:hypothetical protein